MKNNPNYYAIIPAVVRYDKRLSPNAKLLYGEITALCGKGGYCWARNSYFAGLYGVNKVSISRMIKQLIDYGYLFSEIKYRDGSKEIERRYLKLNPAPVDDDFEDELEDEKKGAMLIGINPNVNTPINKNVNTPINKIVKGNNTSNINTSINKEIYKEKDPLTSKNEIDQNDAANITGMEKFSPGDKEQLEPNEKENTKKPSTKNLLTENEFKPIWDIYPKKKGKARAFELYKKARKSGTTFEEIKSGVEKYNKEIKAKNTDPKYIKHADTWFRNRCWEDEYETGGGAGYDIDENDNAPFTFFTEEEMY